MVSAEVPAFLLMATIVMILGLLSLVRMGIVRLESNVGRLRDGPAIGSVAPSWGLFDSAGALFESPKGTKCQLPVFTDISLVEFPGLVEGMNELHKVKDGPEVAILTQRDAAESWKIANIVQADVPIVTVDRDFYWRYNVRVTPFVVMVDERGLVQSTGIVNYRETVVAMWEECQFAQVGHSSKTVRARLVGEQR